MEALATAAIAPAYPDWPETAYPTATVVCEGPGACFASPRELNQALLPGPVIAVNRAIKLSDRIPIDMWALMDDPKPLWEFAGDAIHPEVKFLSGNDMPNIWHWRELLGEDCAGRLYAKEPTYMENLAAVTVDGMAPMLSTIFHVLAWLLKVRARHVRLIGCDMRGAGSPLAGRWNADDDEDFKFRWEIERVLLAHCVRQYRARGARLERWLLS
jgi:hypothetical protein